MRSKSCCFCNIDYCCCGSNELHEAYVPKRKRIYFHLNCVQWSLGFLRKNYRDKDTYVCHLYDSTCNKLCTICNKCNPTIKGDNSHQYYHYHCALSNNIPINLTRYVDFVDYFNEQRKIDCKEKLQENVEEIELVDNSYDKAEDKVSSTPTTICEVDSISNAEPFSLESRRDSKKRKYEENDIEQEKESKRVRKSILHITDNIQTNGYSVYNNDGIHEVDTFLLQPDIHNISNDDDDVDNNNNNSFPNDYYIVNNYTDTDNNSINNSSQYIYFSNIIDLESDDDDDEPNSNSAYQQYISDIGRISSEEDSIGNSDDDLDDNNNNNNSFDDLEPLSYSSKQIHSIISKLISFD